MGGPRGRPLRGVDVRQRREARTYSRGGWLHAQGRNYDTRRRTDVQRVGFDFIHACVDDQSRLAYCEILADERGPTCAGFLRRAAAWFGELGIPIERVMTDNARNYRSPRRSARPSPSWGRGLGSPSPTVLNSRARWSASTEHSSTNGPTCVPTRAARSAQPWCLATCTATTTTEATRRSAHGLPSAVSTTSRLSTPRRRRSSQACRGPRSPCAPPSPRGARRSSGARGRGARARSCRARRRPPCGHAPCR